MTLRWGILGAGGIAATFTSDLQGAGLTVSAVGSRDLAKAREFADRAGVPGAHGSYDDLVADPEVDVVYVATPHPFHAENALSAVAAGKHVLVEKAFTVNAAEAERVYAAARDAGVVVLEAMWTRYTPQSARLREVVRSGVIGEVRLLTAVHVQSLPTDPRHRINDPTLSDQGVDARVAIQLGHASGATAQLYAALDTSGRNTATLLGTAGRIDVDDTFYAPGGFTVRDSDDAVVERFDADEGGLRGMHHQALELERVVAAGERESPVLTAADGVGVMRTMDEVRRQIGVRYPSEG
jgi:predicted dehydrogenase